MRLVELRSDEESSEPAHGQALSIDDIEMLAEAIQDRQRKFKDEAYIMSFALVLMNVGDRYAPVVCSEGEWTGLKKDIPRTKGQPACPSGHSLKLTGPGLTIGWLQTQDDAAEESGDEVDIPQEEQKG